MNYSGCNPRHIAAVMDGNARWARRNNLTLKSGYEKGADSAWNFVLACIKHKIKFVTLYAFSVDNWNRDNEKVVSPLMSLLESHLSDKEPLLQNGIKIVFIGELSLLPRKLQDMLADLSDLTATSDNLNLYVALSYGSHEEIISAVKSLIKKNIPNQQITKELFESYLYTSDCPSPDLLIRTGGEKRLSNFLLWQMSYTELYFSDKLWPDFCTEDLNNAIEDYQRRERRYGL